MGINPNEGAMRKCPARLGLIAVLLLSAGFAFGQTDDKEPTAILEFGGAGERGLKGGGASYGPNLAVETTPIEHWLELEAGITPFFRRGKTEWDTDLLFKKPFTLSDTAEVMFGVGPSWSHSGGGAKTADSVGAEAAVDFMFWPWPSRRVGWYVEPSYGYGLGSGHEQTLGVSVGLLIPLF
jgi:hypothetical protein